MTGLQHDECISQQIPHHSTAPGTRLLADFAGRQRRGRICCRWHRVNSDMLWLGMVAVLSFVASRSARACYTDTKQLTIKLFVYHSFECDSQVYDPANIVTDKVYYSESVRFMLCLWSLKSQNHGPPQFLHWCTPFCHLFP